MIEPTTFPINIDDEVVKIKNLVLKMDIELATYENIKINIANISNTLSLHVAIMGEEIKVVVLMSNKNCCDDNIKLSLREYGPIGDFSKITPILSDIAKIWRDIVMRYTGKIIHEAPELVNKEVGKWFKKCSNGGMTEVELVKLSFIQAGIEEWVNEKDFEDDYDLFFNGCEFCLWEREGKFYLSLLIDDYSYWSKQELKKCLDELEKLEKVVSKIVILEEEKQL